MKNLHEEKTRLSLNIVLSFVIVLLQFLVNPIIKVIDNSFFEEHAMAITVVSMFAFTLLGLLMLTKNLKKYVIAEAMIKNEIRLKSDRKSWPSKNENVTAQKLANTFKENGFSCSDNEDGYYTLSKKGNWKTVFTFIDGDRNAEDFINLKAQSLMKASSRYDKRAFAYVFVTDKVSAEDKELAADAVAIENGCILPVFYETSTNKAYYMGGDTGRNSPENALQPLIKELILNYKEDFPEKTDADKTDAEKEFERLDIKEIFTLMKTGSTRDLEVLKKMEEDEIRLEKYDTEGTVYYKHNGEGVVLDYKENGEKDITLEKIENLLYLMPEKREATEEEAAKFKTLLENFLTRNGYTFNYKEEE